MPDHIDRYTDQQEAAYARKIADTYKQAAQEVRRQITEFTAKHKAKAAKLLQKVNAGEISMADYQAWLQGQVFIGKQWQDKLDDIVRVYTDADEKARQLMRGTVRDVFTESANFAAYQLEGRLGAAVDFHLYDASTVDQLMRTNPQMLPEWKINEKKDYTWNEERVRSTLTRAIIQGKPIPDIADELGQQLATSNGDKMVLFARTAMTGAQNAGRIERLHDTQQMGIRVKKKWLAAHDARVRDTHAYLDGQERDVDEDFVVGDMHIAYPGDPLAPPELVYNCRCTMIYVYPEHQAEHQGEKTESYEAWKERKSSKEEEQEKTTKQHAISKRIEFTDVFTEEQQKAVVEVLDIAQSEYPLPYEFDFVGDGRIPRGLPHESIWDLKDNYPERKMDFGEAAQYISIKKPDGTIERRIDFIDDRITPWNLEEMYDGLYKSHKGFEENPDLSHALFTAGNGVQGTILHEYGHAVQDYCGFFLRQTPEGTAFEKWIRDYSYEHPEGILSISRYAGEGLAAKDPSMRWVNPSEVWAEAFVTSFDQHHDTLAWRTANDIVSEFNRRFGHMFKKR